jgi:hypothetical protein
VERFFTALSAGNATTMVLVTTELLGFYTISTMLLLRWRPLQRCPPCPRMHQQHRRLQRMPSPAAGPRRLAASKPVMQASNMLPLRLPCRRQLPLKYRAIISDAIGGEMEFDMLHRWFNSTFLASASASLALFYGLLRQKRQEASDRLPLYVTPSLGAHDHSRTW